jgi:iron complex transport system substrate-binding protein
MLAPFRKSLLCLLSWVLFSCGGEPTAPTSGELPPPAAPRVASLAPALSHMLFAMGLGDQVVGVSRYCTLPEGEQRPVLGDALTVSTEAVLAVEPDLLLVQSDPAKYEPLRALDPGLQVEHFTIETTADIVAAQKRLGQLAGHQERGERHASRLEAGLAELRAQAEGLDRPRVLFVMGSEKPGSAGRGSFVHEIIELAGGENAAAELEGWPTLNLEYVLAAQPEVLICWTSPQDAERDRERWLALEDLPAAQAGRVHVVTETTWTLPTPVLLEHARQLRAWFHPSDGQP